MDGHMILSIFHIFVVAPLFFAIAFFRNDLPPWAFYALIGLALVLFAYQGYKWALRVSQGSVYAWVNAIHVLFVAPLLLYVGVNGPKTPTAAYELCAMTGFAVLGYHLYWLIKMIHVIPATSN